MVGTGGAGCCREPPIVSRVTLESRSCWKKQSSRVASLSSHSDPVASWMNGPRRQVGQLDSGAGGNRAGGTGPVREHRLDRCPQGMDHSGVDQPHDWEDLQLSSLLGHIQHHDRANLPEAESSAVPVKAFTRLSAQGPREPADTRVTGR